ncbi:MAG: hypothetical protein RIR00_1974 [Pseudomonadota bacterium]
MVLPAVDLASCARVAACSQRYPGCAPAYGIHPLYTPAASSADLARLGEWLARADCVAVGEIGLDAWVPGLDMARQLEFFRAQLKLARDAGLPVLLHLRRTIDPVLRELRRCPVPGGIAHAFNGSRQQADVFIDLGFKLGFGGSLSYSGSTRIRHLAATLPASSLVLETDAPDIPPVWLRQDGQVGRNQPAELPRIAAELAALRGVTPAELAAATTANARAVLPKLRPLSAACFRPG